MPTPLIHITDLYHPPCDPDDHWDLASLYALAQMGRVDLLGVVIDHPLPPDPNGIVPMGAGEPAVQALAQMNYISGRTVPSAIGTGVSFDKVAASMNGNPKTGLHGPDFILETLRRSARPAVITVAGSCRDVAIAGHKDPALFKEKCAAIYLNAGSASSRPVGAPHMEWNVSLDPAAYREVLGLPCPVYWMPCFEDMTKFETSRHGSYWKFRQADVLGHLSPPVQNYFLHALTRSSDQRWMSVILGGVNAAALEIQCNANRNMWCTAGFLHLAGLTVTRSGDLVDLAATSPEDALFHFFPVNVHLNGDGRENWEPADKPGNRFLFEINDTGAYDKHMTTVLRTLLEKL